MIQKRQIYPYSKDSKTSKGDSIPPGKHILDKLSTIELYHRFLMYIILIVSLAYLVWITTTVLWINSFWALPIYKEKTLIGIKQDHNLLMLPYRKALDVIFSNEEIPENLPPSKKVRSVEYSQQLCIEPSIEALKIKKACKPIKKLSIFDKIMCANKIVVKSCKLKELAREGKYIYLTEEGLKSYDK